MSAKVIIIGIDSMDSILLNKFIEELPNFKQLKHECPNLYLKSVFPPDSDTAWASIYTGLNPAKHGVVNFVDPLQKSIHLQTKEGEADLIRGNTLWDILTKHGYKSCILLPHIAYPPWDINGIMISRSRIKDDVISIPEMPNSYNLNELNALKGVPKKDKNSLSRFIRSYKNLVNNETDLFIKMLRSSEWDIFFCYSSALDAIQHYFWDLCEDDKMQPNPFSNTIKEFYMLYDSMVGKLISSINDNTTVIILSDHGHTGRPKKNININRILKDNNFIKQKTETSTGKIYRGVATIITEIICRYNLGWLVSKFFKIAPNANKLYPKSPIDESSSLAYTTDLSGIKSYTYGGIIINRNMVRSTDDVQNVRTAIINMLKKELKDKIDWITEREKMYTGKYINKYPDILLQLQQGYGIGNKIDVPVISDAGISDIVPGSHRGDTPILFIHNSKKKISRKDIELVDIAPTVLDLFNIDWTQYGFDGSSIF